jgi:phosphatidylglycerophosphate synthase
MITPNAVTSIRLLLLIPLFLAGVAGGPEGSWLAVTLYLLAGATDVVDGQLARRTGQVSLSGAMLDLIADRLLKLTALAVLAVDGGLSGAWLLPMLILFGRDLVVATLTEHLPGKLGIYVSPAEKVKIAFQFTGPALLMAPDLGWNHTAGRWALVVSAALALLILTDYIGRARRALAAEKAA